MAIPNPDNMSLPELEKFCNTPVQAAAYMGDTERVRELIHARADLNTSNLVKTPVQLQCRLRLIINHSIR